ncbi:eukaryotic translation initiation factor 5 [Hysterangium stoloniferum]|nr:eukaryotic translation initiation factor 5 [Hysterangium stoloniferum]
MASGPIVNIRRDVDDKFYRYKMPVLMTKIEGKGNGIKTVVPNMSDIARALSRPPTYPTKFFGCELGAQTTFDEKGDRYIVNGAHDATRLRELLDVFIDKFVLCASCKNPETELILTKTDEILRDCKACGQRSGVDMRHKLTTFIVKNPPKTKKKGRKATAGENGETVDTPGDHTPENVEQDGGSDDEITRRIKAEAAELAPAHGSDDKWSADTRELEGKLKSGLVLGDDDSDEDGESPYTQLTLWSAENRDTATAVEIYKKTQELGIEKKHRTVQVLVENLFTENIVKEIPKFASLFKKLVTSERHQKALLGGIERTVGVEQPMLIPAVPKILMGFYQADVLDEEVVTQWGTHVSKKYVDRDVSKRVRKASEPFLKWLEEADDDDDDDE